MKLKKALKKAKKLKYTWLAVTESKDIIAFDSWYIGTKKKKAVKKIGKYTGSKYWVTTLRRAY